MKVFHLKGSEDFIKLGQLLKASGLVDTGADAKYAIEDGRVYLNGEVCSMRGKKIHAGDKISFENEEIIVEA